MGLVIRANPIHKLICVLCAAVIVLSGSGLTAVAYAAELNPPSGDLSGPENQPTDNTQDQATLDNENPELPADTTNSSGISAAIATIAPLAAAVAPYIVTYTPTSNSTIVEVDIPGRDQLITSGVTTVTVEATMNYQGVITRDQTTTVTLSSLAAAGTTSFEMDFRDYGKFSVTARFYSGTTLSVTNDPATVGVTADTYNIAPVSATLPLTFFSISLFGPTSIRYTNVNGTTEIVPTIVMFERPASWNWDNLPEGVYGLPYLTMQQLEYQPGDFNAASNQFRSYVPAFVAYMADLYALNPSSNFNLYCVDYYTGLIQQFIYANKIPTGQYTIKLLSDGAFSYNRYEEVYSGSNPTQTHSNLITSWNTAKQQAYASGQVSPGFSLDQPNWWLYAAVDSEPNASWWLARTSDTLKSGDGNVFATATKNDPQVIAFSIASKLASMSDTDKVAFKALFNFRDTYFGAAEASGQDVMLLLGTTVGTENYTFDDYARFVMAFYGDSYAYYYKGHPGTPTGSYPEKQSELDILGVTDVDSSVPAELILFYYPDIFLSGYQSSTYASVPVGMGKIMFNMDKATGIANPQYQNMDGWMSLVTTAKPAAIQNLCRPGTASYLVEFSDAYLNSINNEYTIAIWDYTDLEICYYKLVNAAYQLVKIQAVDSNIPEEGLYTISSKNAPNLSVDVAWGSLADLANIQLWSDNASPSQTFRVHYAGGSYFTIQNVLSMKMLDVTAAGQAPGTNVAQYTANNTAAQCWKLVDTGDGDNSYYLVSGCNGLNLDVQWAGKTSGSNIWVYTPNGSDAQKFIFNRLEPNVADGLYTLTSALSTSNQPMALDVRWGSLANYANLQLYEDNGTGAQQFQISYDPTTGYYFMVNAQSNRAVDVQYARSSAGSYVWQYDRSLNNRAQMWRFVENPDGTYTIVSATGEGCVLDAQFGANTNGTNIWIYTPNGTAAQQWTLTLQ